MRDRLCSIDWQRWRALLVLGLWIVGVLARLAPIATHRFHQDEAIYSHWALQIATGRDFWLNGFPVDKPPLFIYVLAGSLRMFGSTEVAARLPSELASALSLLLMYVLTKRLYGYPTALAALALLSLSPFHILFAPTALTDTMMVAWVLAALVAAVYGRWGWTGLLLGLGAITKLQALFFVPLVVAWSVLATRRESQSGGGEGLDPLAGPGVRGILSRLGNWWPARPVWIRELLRFVLGLGGTMAPAFVWDALRTHRPGFFQQSVISYGGLTWTPVSGWWERAGEWQRLLTYVTGSSLLDTLLVVGLPLLLAYGLIVRRTERPAWSDWSLALFAGLFLAVHLVAGFNVWDRYLLGLVPCLLLLLARILILPGEILGRLWPRLRHWRAVYGLGVAVLLVLTALRPAQDAAASRFPIGGDHGAYSGLDTLVSYFRGHVPGDSVVYHHWLGWHYSFYMFDFPYLFQYYASPEELAQDALSRPGVPRYIAFPSWHSATQVRWVLRQTGLTLRPIYETYRDDGSRSFTLYRIEETNRHD